MQNMKVDVVYYVVPADFEMEFNLSGCCPMRLLKTLTYTKKEYIDGLARAVSRSKIIIACGPLYGEDGLIKMTARATHKDTEIIDNSEYKIAQDHNVEIIAGSVPLVTTSGLFGGLIIESGPQTIIILSENKDIRRNIMKNLIHQYVQEVSILEIRRSTGASTLSSAPSESSVADETEEDVSMVEINETKGEIVDFSVDDEIEIDRYEEEIVAPSDEELSRVAKEINDLSSDIGKTLYAAEAKADTDNTEADNEPKENEEETPDGFILESTDDNTDEQDLPAEDDKQIDFSIDKDNEVAEEGEENSALENDAQLPDFLFEDEQTQENASETPYGESPLNEYAFVATDDDYEKYEKDDKKSKNKILNRSIIIIAVVLALIFLALIYLLVCVPLLNDQDPGDYMRQIFSEMWPSKVKLFMSRF